MSFDPVELGILWDRVVSIADEVVSALVTTSFSTMVRESGDLSCMLFNGDGASLAQGNFSVPSFTGTGPPTLRHMLRRFPPEALEPGDVVITNDPWLGTGHLWDINVMRPVFRKGRLVAFTLSVTHLPDIGGGGYASTGTEIYAEGLRLPIRKLMRRGAMDEELMELILANVRLPEMVRGDILANIACNEVGGRLIAEFMDEQGLDDLGPLSRAIIGRTEAAMRKRIAAIPDGTYRNRVPVEGIEAPIGLQCAVTIRGSDVTIDFEGTTPALPRAINVPLCYTRAFCNYAIKVLTIPELPNNEGAANPIRLSAPPGCILNAQHPSPTAGRHVIGHFVAPLIFGALAPVLPDQVQAESGMLSQLAVRGETREGRGVSSLFFAAGGFGALRGTDGRDATPGPSNMIGSPVEIWEDVTGMTVLHKRLIPDSGGAGAWRGGNGQEISLRNDTGKPMDAAVFSSRTEFAAQGLDGGKAGALRETLINGKPVHAKGRYTLAPGDVVTTREAGGGGYGDPARRSPEQVLRDVQAGRVTVEGARRDFGVVVDLVANTARRVAPREGEVA
ncbi:MAG TPA: hydantoinase B/oxoprolinase family protein [Acetobacteraceae bacterium]|nr:hydantoinase B/oxoprolinase family protein [Acetobacteraceae bacterium]